MMSQANLELFEKNERDLQHEIAASVEMMTGAVMDTISRSVPAYRELIESMTEMHAAHEALRVELAAAVNEQAALRAELTATREDLATTAKESMERIEKFAAAAEPTAGRTLLRKPGGVDLTKCKGGLDSFLPILIQAAIKAAHDGVPLPANGRAMFDKRMSYLAEMHVLLGDARQQDIQKLVTAARRHLPVVSGGVGKGSVFAAPAVEADPDKAV